MSKFLLQKGQALSGVILATALITSAGTWIAGRILNSPDSLRADITQAEKDIVGLQGSDKRQSEDIKEIKGSVEYIRRVVEEQARRQGIVITENR